MNNFEKFIKISHHIQEINLNPPTNFGTEDFSYYFYGLIKMIKPECVLELGTGYGCTTFISAAACESNGVGKIVTVDDGRSSHNFNLFDFLYTKTLEFELEKFIDFRKDSLNLINPYQIDDIKSVDIIFNDMYTNPESFFGLLSWVLPRVENQLYFFIDKGNHWTTSIVVKNTVDLLNRGKIPKILLELSQSKYDILEIISKYNFSYEIVNKKTMQCQDGFAIFKMDKI